MPSNPSRLADALTIKYKSLEHTRSKTEYLYSHGVIALRDKRQFYEGLFLNTHVIFESFIEDLFFGLLVNGSKTLTPSKIIPRIEIGSHIIARELVNGPQKNYISWLPYENTIKLAKIFFRSGSPFTDLGSAEKDDLRKCHIIRNAIAHNSGYSRKKFESNVIGTAPVSRAERNPTSYLMGVYRISPEQTRYQLYAAKLRQIAVKLTR